MEHKCMQIYSKQHLMQLITLECNPFEFNSENGIIQEVNSNKYDIVLVLHTELNKIKEEYINKNVNHCYEFKHKTVDCLLKFGIVIDPMVLKSYLRKHKIEGKGEDKYLWY